MITFGAKELGSAAGTVHLGPGYIPVADADPIGVPVDTYREVLELQVRHNKPADVGQDTPSTVTYKVLVDDQETDLQVTVAENAVGGSVEVSGELPQYSVLKVIAVKNGALHGTGDLGAVVTIFDQS